MCNIIRVFVQLLLLSGILSKPEKTPGIDINFNQHDYKMIYERANIVSYNKDYFHDLSIATFKYNRSCTSFNVTLYSKVDLDTTLETVVQAFKFASNEYRLFPLRFQFNMCYAFSKNTFGVATMVNCGNYKGCPMKKDTKYQICNFTPEESQFPPFVPNGRYMVEFQIVDGSVEIAVGRAYAEVTRPFNGF